MADVRSLLRNERNARRITHPQATYSTTGTLVCLVCHIQLKSESLWNGHLRSAQHAMRLQRIRDGTLGRPPGAAAPESQPADEDVQGKADEHEAAVTTNGGSEVNAVEKNNKRKADDGEEPARKKSRAGLPEGFFDGGIPEDLEAPLPTNRTPPLTGQEIQLPSRPATPLKTPETTIAAAPKATAAVDEDEWAAFEADIAAADASITADAVIISAPAISSAELAAKSREEENAQRKERQEAEMEGDREDATRKLEVEFDEMEALEERIRKLKEKREALRLKDAGGMMAAGGAPVGWDADAPASTTVAGDKRGKDEEEDDDDEEEEEEDEDDDDDDWDGFRLRAK